MRSSELVQFRAPERLIEQADALAAVQDRDCTDVLLDAVRAYLSDASERDAVKRDLANAYYAGDISHDAVQTLLGPKEAENLRLLREQLENQELTEELTGL